MAPFSSLSAVFWTIGDAFGTLGTTSADIPLIGGWCQIKFYEVSDLFHMSAVHINTLDSWSALVDSALSGILPWDTIQSYILGAWSWLNTIDDRITARALSVWTWLDTIDDKITDRARSVWTWLDTIDDKITDRARSVWTWLDTIDDKITARARSVWTWLDTIDDKIVDRVRSTWDWLDTIDDRIRQVASDNIQDTINDWIWEFLEARAEQVVRLAGRILSAVWNMEWGDDSEAPPPSF